MKAKAKPGALRRKPKSRSARKKPRPFELVDFLQDVALGKKKATMREVEAASKELDEYLPDLEAEYVRLH